MKNIIIMCLVVLGVACTKTETQIVEKEVLVEPSSKIDDACWTCDTLYYKRKGRTIFYPAYSNVGFCALNDTAKFELGFIDGYYGYSTENDTTAFFEIGGRVRSVVMASEWLNDSTALMHFMNDGNEYRGWFKRSL